jgi:NADH-quinone oxidoreductase subunit G
MPEVFRPRQQKWLLLPQYHILGSGELSIYTRGLRELSPDPAIIISARDAEQLDLKSGDSARIIADETKIDFPVEVSDQLSTGVIVASAGLQGMEALYWGTWVQVEKVDEVIKT